MCSCGSPNRPCACRPCGCFGAASCARCVPRAGLWYALGSVGALALLAAVRRQGSRAEGLDTGHQALYDRIVHQPPAGWTRGAGILWEPRSLHVDFKGGPIADLVTAQGPRGGTMGWRDPDAAQRVLDQLLAEGVLVLRHGARRPEDRVYACSAARAAEHPYYAFSRWSASDYTDSVAAAAVGRALGRDVLGEIARTRTIEHGHLVSDLDALQELEAELEEAIVARYGVPEQARWSAR